MENKLLIHKPKNIFFDLTYIIKEDFDIISLECINSIFLKYGKEEIKNSNFKNNNIEIDKDKFLSYFGEEKYEQIYKEYIHLLLDKIPKCTLLDGIENILQFCQDNEINCGIISDKNKCFIDEFLEIFNLKKYFNDIIIRTDTNNITSFFDKIDYESLNDVLLFVGQTLEDIKFSFRFNLIPVIFTEIKIDKDFCINNIEILSKIYHNTEFIRFKNYLEMFKFLEKSKQNWENIKITKITYIGANGKIGKQAINMICSNIPENEYVELLLLGSGSQDSLSRLQGLKKDIKGSLIIQGKNPKVKFIITNDWSKTSDSNIIICCAGRWPTEQEILEFKNKDPSNRLIQSFVNAKMIIGISKKINEYCPKALVLIVTNQVDMMCHIARNNAKNLNIIGLSGSVDSTRLKQKIKDVMGIESEGLMIGYHNSSMIPIIKSLKNKEGKNIFPLLSGEIELKEKDIQKQFEEVEKQKLDNIMNIVRTMGIVIATEQKAGLDPMKNYGAAILPALSITKLINAYCFGNTYIESYNTFISDPIIAKHYGIDCNTELSIPLKITRGKIEQLAEIPLLESEKLSMKEAQINLKKDLKIILGIEYI